MKKLLLSAAAVLVAAPALAADLPRAAEPVAPAYIAPTAFNWTGFYAGLHAGYGFSGRFGSNRGDNISGASGFIGGAQVGYNYQIDPLVIGIEGDISYANTHKKRSYYLSNGAFDGTQKGELTWKGSITPRIGYAIDRLMPYIKGGVAFGETKLKTTGFGVPDGSQSKTLWGWTVGAGVEYAVTDNITTKIEYDYTDLGKKNFVLNNGLAGKVGYRGHEIKAGVNYKF